MLLSWSDQTAIAAALLRAHPEAARLSLRHGQLLQLILALPGFHDSPVAPKPACLDHILWTWMRLADDSGAGERQQA